MGNWDFFGSWPKFQDKTFLPIKAKHDSTEEEILLNLGNLSNHILATAASKKLAAYSSFNYSLRQQKPYYFMQIGLYIQALRITSIYNYKIATRRFVSDLFDKVVWNEESMDKIDEMNGLDLCFAAPTNKRWTGSKEMLEPNMKPVIKDAKNIKKGSTVSIKVIRGF